jgi:4-coumarate--CoA ligase
MIAPKSNNLFIQRPCNPAFTAAEVGHQLRQTTPTLIIAHADVLNTALEAAHAAGLPVERVVVLSDSDEVQFVGYRTVNELVAEGSKLPYVSLTRILKPTEGGQKIAFLSPSSGTTGAPKVIFPHVIAVCLIVPWQIVAISHCAVIANILMVAAHHNAHKPGQEDRYRPGDVCLGILPLYRTWHFHKSMRFKADWISRYLWDSDGRECFSNFYMLFNLPLPSFMFLSSVGFV